MPWAMFDDKSPSNPKLLKAGAEAAWLWHSSICYSNAHALNGRIDKELLTALYPPLASKASRLAVKLVSINLWHDCGDHYEIHDYKHFQSNALKEAVEEKAAARREYERERKRQYRDERKTESRIVPVDVPDIVPDNQQTLSTHVPHAPAPARDARSPIPSHPIPTQTVRSQSEAADEIASAADSDVERSNDPEVAAASRGRTWLTESASNLDIDHTGKFKHALAELSRKPALERAVARTTLAQEAQKPGLRTVLNPTHILDHWAYYSAGKVPGHRGLELAKRPTRVGRVATAEEYAESAKSNPKWLDDEPGEVAK